MLLHTRRSRRHSEFVPRTPSERPEASDKLATMIADMKTKSVMHVTVLHEALEQNAEMRSEVEASRAQCVKLENQMQEVMREKDSLEQRAHEENVALRAELETLRQRCADLEMKLETTKVFAQGYAQGRDENFENEKERVEQWAIALNKKLHAELQASQSQCLSLRMEVDTMTEVAKRQKQAARVALKAQLEEMNEIAKRKVLVAPRPRMEPQHKTSGRGASKEAPRPVDRDVSSSMPTEWCATLKADLDSINKLAKKQEDMAPRGKEVFEGDVQRYVLGRTCSEHRLPYSAKRKQLSNSGA